MNPKVIQFKEAVREGRNMSNVTIANHANMIYKKYIHYEMKQLHDDKKHLDNPDTH